ncbi:MAG: HEAT repeat domain-containing protein [Planctomycetes bacterium]|nr:HEAT repeat domain-containing protein [Planctomycetota bacterium]
MSETEKIVRMLEEGGAELQCAAAMVLGELRSTAARPALLKALKSDNETLRLYAVEALGKIDPKEAAPHLVPMLATSGRLRARIQQVLLSIGEEVVPMLQRHIDKAEPELRRAILEVLGQFKAVDLSDTMFDALADKNPEVARQAAEALRARFAGVAGPDREKAVKQVVRFLDRKLPPASTVAGLRLLGDLRDPAGVRAALGYVDGKREVSIRTAALEALSVMDLSKDADRVAPKVLALVDEEPLVSAALAVLGKLAIPREQGDRVLRLLESRHAAVRLYAIQALGALGGARAAEGLVAGLFSPDRRIADEATRALQGNHAFAPAILKALQAEENVGRAWKIAGVLRAHREAIDAATVKAFLAKCLKLHEKNSAVAQVYGEILRSVAPAVFRDAVVKRGRELMKKRKHEDAERLLRLVAQEDLATSESDFALAEALLVTLRKDLATARLDRSHAVGLFSKLIRRADYPVVKELEKDAAMVGAPSLLYLGFVMIERQGAEREFGAGVLRLVAKKFGRAKEGETARAKLKTQGA